MIRIILLTFIFLSLSISAEEINELFTLERTFFAIGDKKTPIKAELGTSYKLYKKMDLYLAYHHKSLWDVNKASSPVLDSNYNPQIYYYLGKYQNFHITLGILEHLSNGATQSRSRGLNMSFLNFFRNFELSQGVNLDLGIKLYASYKIDNGSPDIVDYNGIWKSFIRLTNFAPFLNTDHSFEFLLSPGGKNGLDFHKGHFEVSLKVRPGDRANYFLFLNHFNGRNEYLLDYKTFQNKTRIGIALDI